MQDDAGRILVVDDNRVFRITLSRAIEQQGHIVETAENGRTALDLARGNSFDVIVLDIVMPEMDGLMVLEEIKGNIAIRDTPVIVVSAVEDVESIVRAIELGAEDYLAKPFNPVILKARLNTSLEKKRLRDLERAYLQQELMLRENEKLATLGKLSAGMAHELNNPASAARSGARQLGEAFDHLQRDSLDLLSTRPDESQIHALRQLDAMSRTATARGKSLDVLARSELESECEDVLNRLGIEEAWKHTAELARLGLEADELADQLHYFSASQLRSVIPWLSATLLIYRLNGEIRHSMERVAAIVSALKSYSHMDEAPIQAVDLRVELESTLAVMKYRVDENVVIRREYSDELPRIDVYGTELNQVWTHLLNNALDALDGSGTITIRTSRRERWAVVQIEDSGIGIAEDVQKQVFDPFFTTKPPGHGAGLGLSVSQHIVVEQHQGEISVCSQPGRTVFEVRLPLSQ
jgi:signal transduction histidine kinase